MRNLREPLKEFQVATAGFDKTKDFEPQLNLIVRVEAIRSICHHFHPGGRHEMLNEINRSEVQTNLLRWILAILYG